MTITLVDNEDILIERRADKPRFSLMDGMRVELPNTLSNGHYYNREHCSAIQR